VRSSRGWLGLGRRLVLLRFEVGWKTMLRVLVKRLLLELLGEMRLRRLLVEKGLGLRGRLGRLAYGALVRLREWLKRR
jgi:hypothetical protein